MFVLQGTFAACHPVRFIESYLIVPEYKKMDLERNKILILTSNQVVHSYYGLFFKYKISGF